MRSPAGGCDPMLDSWDSKCSNPSVPLRQPHTNFGLFSALASFRLLEHAQDSCVGAPRQVQTDLVFVHGAFRARHSSSWAALGSAVETLGIRGTGPAPRLEPRPTQPKGRAILDQLPFAARPLASAKDRSAKTLGPTKKLAMQRRRSTSSPLLSALTLLSIGLTSCGPEPTPAEPEGPRNLLLVCLDTVRADHFWILEDHGIEDRLDPHLTSALSLRNAQAPAPWTVPSVASVLTGLYPAQHGAGHFAARVANLDQEIPSGLSDEVSTVTELLRDNGFATQAFVAHPWFRSGFGLERGFQKLRLAKKAQPLIERAIRWIDDHSKSPDPTRFFVYLHFMEAHAAKRQSEEESASSIAEIPEAVRQDVVSRAVTTVCRRPESPRCRRYQTYVSEVLHLREKIAVLLDELHERELLEETLVILYSDHGEEFREHAPEQETRGLDPREYSGAGHGQSLYQELLHVPVVIWHPGLIPKQARELTSLLDLTPSILDWLDLPSPGRRWPGAHLDRVLEEPRLQANRILFASGISFGPEQYSVRRGPWKRVRFAPEDFELFDLTTDPLEKAPAADTSIATELDRRLELFVRAGNRPTSETPEVSDQDLEKLRAVGYLQGVSRD